ncbi:cell division protein FtsK [Paenibacillus sabinae T27]|uniref:Cell division protein FtsK n=2 Tax=Paenibacillus sabinae TaxID=365617 RepID=X4ZFT7_9BACL|nr:cell division protein FtsK [Paenibacillus sabinae T27]
MGINRQTGLALTERLLKLTSELERISEERRLAYEWLRREIPGEHLRLEDYDLLKSRQEAVQEVFTRDWNRKLAELDEWCRRVRRRQPRLIDLQEEHLNNGDKLPDALAFGRMKLSCEGWSGHVPRLLPFPFKRGIRMSNDRKEQSWLHQLLLRLMTALPANALRIVAYDPLHLGSALRPFLPLLDLQKPFADRRIWTRSEEIEEVLRRELDDIEQLLQRRFGGSAVDWQSYNKLHPDHAIPYKVLVVLHVPEQLTEKSLWYLGRILEFGPACGVLPILSMEEGSLEDRRYDALRGQVERLTQGIEQLLESNPVFRSFRHLAVTEEQEQWPDRLLDLLGRLAERYRSSNAFIRKIRDQWGEAACWTASSRDGISACIGWTPDGREVEFTLGRVDSEHHALLAGRSGSGKSNLLHVLIHSLCHRYAPDELQVYMLDYKQGTEFAVYANPPLPQAVLVATESDPEYGTTVLAHIEQELQRRASAFKRHAVRDCAEYRKNTGLPLPRVLLIIDEFQLLFSENKDVAEAAEKSLNMLLRQGRAYGIHVLLATQTLKGIQSMSMAQLISQIGCRMALACSEEDSAMILGSNNWAAAELKSPPEGILNDANGAGSANRRFLIPYAEPDLIRSHLDELHERSEQRGFASSAKIFNGAHLPPIPDSRSYAAQLAGAGEPALVLGEKLDFSGNPLRLAFDRQQPGHLLIAGHDPVIRQGLLLSVIRSLSLSEHVRRIAYYDAANKGASALREAAVESAGSRIRLFGYEWDGDFSFLDHTEDGKADVLIIDGLENAKPFHSAVPSFGKPKDPASPADSLRRTLESGHSPIVIAVVDNWRKANAACKDLLPQFELKIGYRLSEDDAGALVQGGGFAKLKGLDNGNKAVFIDKLKNRQDWFRPYCDIHTEKDEPW